MNQPDEARPASTTHRNDYPMPRYESKPPPLAPLSGISFDRTWLTHDRVETLTNARLAVAQFGRAIATIAQDAARSAAGLLRLKRAIEALPEPHSFRPDYDLRCTVARCDLTAEQH